MVYSEEIELQTRGFGDTINITERVNEAIRKSRIRHGIVNVFSLGTTGAVTIIEYEEGVITDLKMALEQLAPVEGHYEHNRLNGDGNGFSHVRSALMKPSIAVPVKEGALLLGTWQEVVFIDFDNRARNRKLIVQIVGQK